MDTVKTPRRRRSAVVLLLACGLPLAAHGGAVGPAAAATSSALAGSTSSTVAVSQDTYTSQGNPSATHGSFTYLAMSSATGDERRTYLRFTVPSAPAGTTGVTASLRVYAPRASTAPVTVNSVASTWTEGSLTWKNQPAPGAYVTGRAGLVAGLNVFDVSSDVRGSGTFSFVLRTASATQVTLRSANYSASQRATLVVTWSTTLPAAPVVDPVLGAAGDIACSPGTAVTAKRCQQAATAALLAGSSVTAIQTLGDNQYENGSSAEFAGGYAKSWGTLKGKTHPATGNHEYGTLGASGYFGYFGSAAGTAGKGYYSYTLGTWHIVVLNSGISFASGSAQDVWFRNDLATHPTTCAIAVWHEPVFASGASNTSRLRLFQDAVNGGVDIVLNGHAHLYERFAPQDASGRATSNGVVEFVVGTGGSDVGYSGPAMRNSRVRGSSFGVLKLTLHPTSYDWRFVSIPGSTFTDSGTGACH